MAASKTIGGINVTITASVDKFQKGMKSAQKILLGFTRSIKDAVFSLKGFAAALAMGAFVKLTHSTMESIAAMGDLSDKLGVSTEKLAGLQLAAEEAGISNTVLEKSLTTLSNTMGVSGDVALRQWIEKTSKLTTQQEKLAAATAMFGARGSSMVRFLNGGVGALDEAQKAAEGMGLALDRASVIGVDRALESFERLKKTAGGLFRQLAVDIAPYVEVLNVKLTNFLTQGGKAKSVGASIASVLIAGIGRMGDLIQQMVDAALAFYGKGKAVVSAVTSPMSTFLGYAGAPGFGPLRRTRTSGSIGGAATSDSPAPGAFSTWLNKAVADARAEAAKDVATRSAGRGFGGVFKNLGEQAMSSNLVRSLQDYASQAAKLPKMAMQGIGKLQWDLMMGRFSNPAKAGTSPGVRSLSANDPLSREGFGQRVRSLAQNDLAKIGKQQLTEQQKIRVGIEKMAKGGIVLAPANLAGG